MTIKELLELGFTPLNGLLILALVMGWRVFQSKDSAQTKAREDWHADTRKQLDEVKAHTVECEKDRARLNAALLTRCPRSDCPISPHAPLKP